MNALRKLMKILKKEEEFDKEDYEEAKSLISLLKENERELDFVKIIDNGNPEMMVSVMEEASIWANGDDAGYYKNNLFLRENLED